MLPLLGSKPLQVGKHTSVCFLCWGPNRSKLGSIPRYASPAGVQTAPSWEAYLGMLPLLGSKLLQVGKHTSVCFPCWGPSCSKLGSIPRYASPAGVQAAPSWEAYLGMLPLLGSKLLQVGKHT